MRIESNRFSRLEAFWLLGRFATPLQVFQKSLDALVSFRHAIFLTDKTALQTLGDGFWGAAKRVAGVWIFAVHAHAGGLPDTGQTTCYDGSAMVACTAANSGDMATYPRQDGRFGRDAKAAAGTQTKIGGGAAGFDYSKVANDGSSLAASATLGTAGGDWACTRDNITGLLWEVKTTSGLRDQSFTYSWYNSNVGTNAGTVSGGNCQTTGRCDTEKFVADVNAAALCGFADWRLPSPRELLTLVHAGARDPCIDTSYFPNTQAENYWSGSSNVTFPPEVWTVSFSSGGTNSYSRKSEYYFFPVRLVRGGQF